MKTLHVIDPHGKMIADVDYTDLREAKESVISGIKDYRACQYLESEMLEMWEQGRYRPSSFTTFFRSVPLVL